MEDTRPLSLTKWAFLKLPNGSHHAGIDFQLYELSDGWLYKWRNGIRWYAAKVKNREAAWVMYRLTVGDFLQWATLDKEQLT